TKDQVVILGRKTYESMDAYYQGSGREMPGRKYLVVTRDQSYRPERENAKEVFSVQQALDLAKGLSAPEVFVIGGGSIFKEVMPLVGRIYMTKVKADLDGDTFFPKLKTSEWEVVESEAFPADERNEYSYEFLTYDRAKGALQS